MIATRGILPRMFRTAGRLVLAALLPLCVPAVAGAQIDARMFRQPDVSGTHIAFVYAGDIWVVPKTGGLATRLTSALGEELFPRFSPDGAQIAFSANYDGNLDVYVVASLGGDPVRLTHHPMDDRVLDWHPDGKRVLFASSRESGRQRFNQFYVVPSTGGMPEKLPVPYGEFASFSPDGREVAYVPQTQSNRTWKRYRGGWAADIWRFNMQSFAAANVTKHDANDEFPMWQGDTVYFLSDRGSDKRYNIWAIDTKSNALRQVTHVTDYDITYPAIGPDDIVFEAGGRFYLLDLKTEQTREVQVQVVTDRTTLKPRSEKVTKLIARAGVSPTGKRAVFQARGDVFTVPAEFGPVFDVTRTSGSAERYPRWSPDGKTLAYWSDRSGEYELTLRPADGTGAEQSLTTLGPGFRYMAHWSPDSKRLAFVDQAMKVRVLDIATRALADVDQSPLFLNHGALEGFLFRWSADSRWLTWSRPVGSGNNAIFVYDTKEGAKHQLTSGYFNDAQPVFDPEGKYLYFFSDRNFEPVYSDFDNAGRTRTRRRSSPCRCAATCRLRWRRRTTQRLDERRGTRKEGRRTRKEGRREEGRGEEGRGTGDEGRKEGRREERRRREGRRRREAGAGIDRSGRLRGARGGAAAEGRQLRADFRDQGQGALSTHAADRIGRQEGDARLLRSRGARGEDRARGRRRCRGHRGRQEGLVRREDKKYAIVEVKEEEKFEKPLRTDEMETTVDPRAEWRQMFADAYRFERDFFYDPNLHGVDWKAARDRYAALIDDGGHALGRELRARRVHRRAERVAHLPRRRRSGRGARARRRHARRRLGGGERRLSHQANRLRRRVGRRCAVTARRARRGRQGRRLRPRRERRAARRP